MDPSQTQDPQQTPAPQIDQAAIDARADEIASAKIEQMKSELAASIGGKSGYETPKTWEELENRSVARSRADSEAIAKEAVKTALEARDKEVADQQKQTLAQTKAQQDAEWSQMSREWAEAVQDGVIPDIKPEIKAKLTSGTDYSALTPEEQSDPGLKAYNDGRILHGQLKQQGKSTSFYRTLEKFYNKMPAGANAPVLGGSTPTPQPTEEFTYEQVKANRKAKLNF